MLLGVRNTILSHPISGIADRSVELDSMSFLTMLHFSYLHRRFALTVNNRVSSQAIDPLFLKRWSPRAFDGSPLGESDILKLIEAARWAPSASNTQPWRFIYALNGGERWQDLFDLLIPFNQGWAANASALVFIVSDTVAREADGSIKGPFYSHAFDTGAAWGMFALQAAMDGLFTHGMTGLDFDKAPAVLGLPEGYRVEAAVAVGRIGDKTQLPEYLQERETPSGRKPLEEIAFSGRFG